MNILQTQRQVRGAPLPAVTRPGRVKSDQTGRHVPATLRARAAAIRQGIYHDDD